MTDFAAYRDGVQKKLLSTVGACGSTGLPLSALHRTYMEDWDEPLVEVMKKLGVRTIDDLLKLFGEKFRIFNGALFARMDGDNGSLNVFELIVGSEGNKKPERRARSMSSRPAPMPRPAFQRSGANAIPVRPMLAIPAVMPPSIAHKKPMMRLGASQPAQFVPARVQSMMAPRLSGLASSSPQQKPFQPMPSAAQPTSSHMVTSFQQKQTMSSVASSNFDHKPNLASSSPQLVLSSEASKSRSVRPRIISTDLVRKFLPKPLEPVPNRQPSVSFAQSQTTIQREEAKPVQSEKSVHNLPKPVSVSVRKTSVSDGQNNIQKPMSSTVPVKTDEHTHYHKYMENRASWTAQPPSAMPKIPTAVEKQRAQWYSERIVRSVRNNERVQSLKAELNAYSTSDLKDIEARNRIEDTALELITLTSQHVEDICSRMRKTTILALQLSPDDNLHQTFKNNIDAGKISA